MQSRLAITSADSPLAQALVAALQAVGADIQTLSDAEQPACVLNLAIFNPDLQAANQATDAAIHYAQQQNLPCIHLSSYQVFSADKKHIHSEKDEPHPLTDQDRFWFDRELAVALLPQHIILRTSWLIASRGDNLLTRLLSAFMDGERVQVHRRLRGAPTSIDDLARVIWAVFKQIQCGAANWGVMHYCSSDHCSEEEFAEQILQYLIQYQLLTAEPSLQLVGDDDDEAPTSAVLACRRLRDNFGVQARSWRPNLLLLIKDWLAQRNLSSN